MKRIIAIMIGVAVFVLAGAAFLASIFFMPGMGSTQPSTGTGGGYAGAPPVSPEEYESSSRTANQPEGAFAYDQDQTVGLDFFAAEPKRLIIKNADLSIVVKDPAAKMQEIAQLAEAVGGYVVSSNTNQSYLSDGTKVPEGSMMLRVPQEKLSEVLEAIKANVVEVQTDTLSGQDVTKEYTDLSSQLKNLQATEKKLTEIMDKAEKTEDVLAVFNQLTQIRGQIDVIVGQMKYYEQSAAMSAVNVRIVAEKTIKPIEIAGWQPQGQARDAAQALVNFFQGFVNFLIWLVIFFVPVLLVLLLLGLLLWRLGKWFWRKAFAKKE